MDNKLKHIDDYFKKRLEGLESNSSVNLWRKLSLLMILKKFGIWIGIGLIVGAIILTYWFMIPEVNHNHSEILTKNNSNIESAIDTSYSQEKKTPIIDKNIKSVNKLDSITLGSKSNALSTSGEATNIHVPEPNLTLPQNKQRKIISSSVYSDAAFQIAATSQELAYIDPHISKLPILYQGRILVDPTEYSSIEIKTKSKTLPLFFMPAPDESKQHSTSANKWSIDLFANPTYVVQSLSATDDLEEYVKYREDSEEPAFSIGFGAEIKYSIKNFFIQSGLNYSDYSQNYQYNTTTYNIDEYYVYDTTWVWIIDPPFIDPYPISIDSNLIPVYEPITSTLSGKSQYRYLEIPILVGYQHFFKKFQIEISSGISYGFLLSASGKLPELSNSSFIDLDNQTDLIQNNVNFLLYLGVEYKINNKWGILIKPNYKQNLNSTYSSDYPVKQKFTTFGVAFGVRIKL